jgi:hypothetical protein
MWNDKVANRIQKAEGTDWGVVAVTPLSCILEVPAWNLDMHIGYPDS